MGCCLVVGGDVSSVSKMLAGGGTVPFRGDKLGSCARDLWSATHVRSAGAAPNSPSRASDKLGNSRMAGVMSIRHGWNV